MMTADQGNEFLVKLATEYLELVERTGIPNDLDQVPVFPGCFPEDTVTVAKAVRVALGYVSQTQRMEYMRDPSAANTARMIVTSADCISKTLLAKERLKDLDRDKDRDTGEPSGEAADDSA